MSKESNNSKSSQPQFFTLDDIRVLLETLEKHDVREFKLSKDGEELWLKRGNVPEHSNVPRFQQIITPSSGLVPQFTDSAAQHFTQNAGPGESSAQPEDVGSGRIIGATDSKADKTEPAMAGVIPKAAVKKQLTDITSPMVGTFYRRPAVDAEPYVGVGDPVKKGQVLCIVEAMKLMNEIESDVSGKIVEICLEDGQMVEYGETLFRIEAS